MIKNVRYLLTTHLLEKMPIDELPEVVIVGKSNVGKSTLINSLTNIKKIAKVSSRPGKTRAISFFQIDDKWRLVDIPGYGFSNVSKTQKEIFDKMLKNFFSERKNIKLVILLLDIRRIISDLDIVMLNLINNLNKKIIIIGTKLDKTNQSERNSFVKQLEFKNLSDPILYSSKMKETLASIIKKIEEIIL